jgi:hypothetical protein
MVTVDDQLGDSLTGELPVYAPPDRWTQGTVCAVCQAKPDPTRALSGSEFLCTSGHAVRPTTLAAWHDSTVFGLDPNVTEVNVTLKFTGDSMFSHQTFVDALMVTITRTDNPGVLHSCQQR